MKKILTMIVALIIALSLSTTIIAFDFDIFTNYPHYMYYNGEADRNVPIIEFTEEYFSEMDVMKRLSNMLDGVSENDIDYKHYSVTEEYVSGPGTTYYDEAKTLGGAFELYRETSYHYGNHLVVYPDLSAVESITVHKEAFEYLPDSFTEYINTVDTLEKALETYTHFEYSEEYFSEKGSLALLCPLENVVEGQGEEHPLIDYASDLDMWYAYALDDYNVYAVYMQDPHSIKILYAQDYFCLPDPNYYGMWNTYVSLNYSPSDGELTSVVFDLSYYIPEIENAPQTGFATVAYAAVAVVSAAAAVVIGKKRR